MAVVRNAIMKCSTRRRVATNFGHTVVFEPGVEKLIPGIIVGECRKYGAEVVRYVGGEREMPKSKEPHKVPHLVTSTVHEFPEGEPLPGEVPDEALERLSSSSDIDEQAAADAAIEQRNKLNRKEERVKNAILQLISENDPDNFVVTTGAPKVSAISAKLNGDACTAEFRNLVMKKMETLGLLEPRD